MEIDVVWGRATGRTELSAFDGALEDAGVHNYNLVELSSVLPPEATVREVGTHDQRYRTGRVVPAVLAEAEASEPGVVAAGIGWRRAAEGGVFYEASGDSADACRQKLRAGLADAQQLRDWDWQEETEYRIVEYPVEQTSAAIVAAIFPPLHHDD